MEIGFIGLGNMGFPMARRLIQGDHQLVVFDTRDRSGRARRRPRRTSRGIGKEVADRVETVMVSLPTPTVSLEVATGPAV